MLAGTRRRKKFQTTLIRFIPPLPPETKAISLASQQWDIYKEDVFNSSIT
jgi:hypothetical protein